MKPFLVYRPARVRLVDADGQHTVDALFIYDPADPWAVSVAFHPGTCDAVTWSFDRQLFADGLDGLVGAGDVRLWPWSGGRGEWVALVLSSPDGLALFKVDRRTVAGFLRSTYGSVPRGREDDGVDWDAGIAGLLDKGASL